MVHMLYCISYNTYSVHFVIEFIVQLFDECEFATAFGADQDKWGDCVLLDVEWCEVGSCLGIEVVGFGYEH